jgi:hypothetical protein
VLVLVHRDRVAEFEPDASAWAKAGTNQDEIGLLEGCGAAPNQDLKGGAVG